MTRRRRITITKIQLKRIYKKIYQYNNTKIKQYDSLENIAKALSTVYTQGYNKVDYKNNIIYYPEFYVKCLQNNNKYEVVNITYFTKNNQVKDLF